MGVKIDKSLKRLLIKGIYKECQNENNYRSDNREWGVVIATS